MITILICSSVASDIKTIKQLLTTYSIQNSWAECTIETAPDAAALDKLQQADVLIADVSDPRIVSSVKEKKKQYPPLLVFPIAGPDISPTVYVCPEIMPYGLFWRPVSSASATPVIQQMMACLHSRLLPRSQLSFRISGKQKIQDIPFSSILFFEAREKKIVLRMAEQELTFNETLSRLEEQLPPEFTRCHKSFLVNRNHILSVDRTNALILLDNHMELPLSRGYRKVFLEEYHNEP